MKSTPFPFREAGSRILDLKPARLDEKSSDSQIPKFAWLSDGAVRPIEEGLPIYVTPSTFDSSKKNPMHSLIQLIEDKPFLKEFNRDYGDLAVRHPEYDLNDPDMMSHYEKQLITEYYSKMQEQQSMQPDSEERAPNPKNRVQDLKIRVHDGRNHSYVTSRIPVDAHLNSWGDALPYYESDLFDVEDPTINNKKPVKRKMRTGIYGDQKLQEQDESSIIREVHFKSLENESPDLTLAKDAATRPLTFAPGGKRFTAEISKIPGGKTDPTCQQCIKRFFDPEVGIPFVPADVGKYFPADLLLPETEEQKQKEQETSSNNSISKLSQTLDLQSTTNDDTELKSTLLDTTGEDVLFTVNKAPFTRNDVATLRAFGNHWDSKKIRQREKAQSALLKRQTMINQAFHSREIFDTYLKLLDEDCKRIKSGVLGKSKYKRKSLWQVAVETTPIDHSGLSERREFWWRFCSFVRFNGGNLNDKIEKDFIKLLRIKLMLRHPVDQSFFWDVLKEIELASFENVATLRMIEYLRFALNVSQHDYGQFLYSLKISQMIYNQTILNNTSREYIDKMNEIANGPVDVPPID